MCGRGDKGDAGPYHDLGGTKQSVATIRRETLGLNVLFNIIRLKSLVPEYAEKKTDVPF